MSIFTRYAMDALMKTTHPEVNRKQCWNLHPHRTPAQPARTSAPMVMRFSPAPTSSRTGIPAPTAACASRPAGRAALPLAGAGAAGHLPCRQRWRHYLDRLRKIYPEKHCGAHLRLGLFVGSAGLPCPEQEDRPRPDPLRRVRERCLRRASACRSDPAGGVLRPAPVRGPVHAGIRAGRCPLPRQGVLPP